MRAGRRILAPLLLVLGLAGCGETPAGHAVLGAGIGALGAAAFDGDPLLGAAAGALSSALYCERTRNCR